MIIIKSAKSNAISWEEVIRRRQEIILQVGKKIKRTKREGQETGSKV